MTLVLFTGTVATVSHEIDWLLNAQMRVIPAEGFAGWSTLEQAVLSRAPEDQILSLGAVAGPRFAYRARLLDEHGRHYFMHLDPYRGTVTGIRSTLTVQRFFRDLHRYLYMPAALGLPIVTAMAFVLAISLYTGLKTARNWRTLATRVRLRRGVRVAVGDSHKALGLWGSWFFLVIIATSLWYLAEFVVIVGGERMEPARPQLAAERLASFGAVAPQRPLGDVVAAARAHYPELRPRTVYFPRTLAHPYDVQGRNSNPLLRDRANRVFVDPVNLTPLKVQRSEAIGTVAWLNELADPLHFGYFGGLASKLVWLLFGLAMTAMSLTGLYLYVRRLAPAGLSPAQLGTLPVLLAAVLFAVPWYQRLVGPSPVDTEVALQLDLGEELRGIVHREVLAPGLDMQLTAVRVLILAQNGRPNVASIVFEHPKLAAAIPMAPVASGRRTLFRGQIPTSVAHDEAGARWRITLHNGETRDGLTLEPSVAAALPQAFSFPLQ